MLFRAYVLQPEDMEADKIKAEAVFESMKSMGYTAAGVSSLDLAMGVDFLKQLEQKNKVPLLSMNLLDAKTMKPVFQPYLLANAGKQTIAVLGITDAVPDVSPAAKVDTLRIKAWPEVLPDVLEEVAGKADMIVLLSSLPSRENEKIAQRFDTIHIILQGGHSGPGMNIQELNNTILCQAGQKGKYLGALDISWNDTKKWGEDVKEQQKKLKNEIDRFEWQINRMKNRYPQASLEKNTTYQQLRVSLEKASKQFHEIETTTDKTGALPCSYTNNFLGLKSSLKEDRTVKTIVDSAKRRINTLNRKTLKPQKPSGPNDVLINPLTGWQKCGGCHPSQTKFWEKTKHALSWKSLEAKNSQFDPRCLVCHVTLNAASGNSQILRRELTGLTPSLKVVGCEACHGPGNLHVDLPRSAPMHLPTEKTCRKCHTPEHSKNFEFAQYMDQIVCPKVLANKSDK